MKNQKIKFGIVKAFLLFTFFLNVINAQSTNYPVQANTTIGSEDVYTKKLKLKPKSSQLFSRKFKEKMMITVQIASGDLGSGRIVAEVYDPGGKMVASGSKEFSFDTKNIKGNYQFVVTNKSKNHQSVEVSINTSGNYKM